MDFNTTIVIPTYWGRPQGSRRQTGDAAFDHPTPLDGDSTLPRLLESLTHQTHEGTFTVVVLAAAVTPTLDDPVAVRVADLLGPYHGRLSLAQVDGRAATLLQHHLADLGHDPELAAFRSYASVRNLQLLVPAVLGAQAIVALDDDEVVAPDYLTRALSWVGKSYRGQEVIGVTGAYENADGIIYLDEPAPSGELFADKSIYMNQAFHQLEAHPDPLPVASLALGGNMVFHRDLFMQVGFDPHITRGEDTDCLINARLAGRLFHYDRRLRITHLPPRHYESPAYLKLREDVIRFIYERHKLELGGLAPETLDPYPGALLKDDLETHALAALENQADPEMVARYGVPDQILETARAYAAERAPAYFEFAERWPAMVASLCEEAELREGLLELLSPP